MCNCNAAPYSGLRIKETKEVYEGEVTELTPCETENPMGGYGKTISHVIIGLKTAKGTKQLKVRLRVLIFPLSFPVLSSLCLSIKLKKAKKNPIMLTAKARPAFCFKTFKVVVFP